MREDSRDPQQLLKSYWHGQLDRVEAPPDIVDRALRQARHAGPIHVESRFGRPFIRAITGLAGVAAVGFLVFLAVSHHGGTSASASDSSASLHGDAAGTAAHRAASRPSQPFSGRVAAFAQSAGHSLWTVAYSHGNVQLWTKPALSRQWHLAKTVSGTGRPVELGFSGKTGWLLVSKQSGGLRAWVTRDNGKTWAGLALPALAQTSAEAALSDVGGAPLYLALGRAGGRTALYRESAASDNWVRETVQGLSGRLSAIRIHASGHGAALAGGTLYETQDGGRHWSIVGQSATMAYTSANSTSNAELAPSAGTLQTALLQGRESRVGGVDRVAYHGALWRYQHHAWHRVAKLPAQGSVKSLTFVTVASGYVLFKSGMIYATHDGGRTWVHYHNE